ncbi:hypothetical protein WJU16_03135 [Chitinophaga pollutisoli]|uniref:DUF4292 domain-containing protein n=1 Tax=Chitinophaga pollutisoli TaxID=3133966 RepID=A0ABZ2YQH6_9BACT
MNMIPSSILASIVFLFILTGCQSPETPPTNIYSTEILPAIDSTSTVKTEKPKIPFLAISDSLNTTFGKNAQFTRITLRPSDDENSIAQITGSKRIDSDSIYIEVINPKRAVKVSMNDTDRISPTFTLDDVANFKHIYKSIQAARAVKIDDLSHIPYYLDKVDILRSSKKERSLYLMAHFIGSQDNNIGSEVALSLNGQILTKPATYNYNDSHSLKLQSATYVK